MAKRKDPKSEKKSSPKKPSGPTKATGPAKASVPAKAGTAKASVPTRTQRPRAVNSAGSSSPAGGPSALTPAPAIPASRGKRERATRGGKSTLSTHEFLAEVLPYPALHAPGETLSLSQIYETLAALLVPYARKMESEMHPKIGFCLKAKSAKNGRETHFGAVQILPDVVAYHLFPLYAHPDLLKNVSPELSGRLRGQTCFHFETLHAGLVAELAELTHAGFERFMSDGVL